VSAPSRLETLMSTMVASIVERDAVAARAEDRARWHRAHGVEGADLSSFAEVDDQAFFVYRHLVRDTLRGAIANQLPKTSKVLGARFERDVAAYVDRSLPASHYLRDVPFEFAQRMGAAWARDPELPPWLVDLARFELLEFESAASAAGPPLDVVDTLQLDAPVAFDPSLRLFRSAYPVHEIDPASGAAVEPRPTALLVYRDAEHDLCNLEVDELTAEVVARLLEHETLGAAITSACAARGTEPQPEILGALSETLADWASQGILLGAASAPRKKRGTSEKTE